MLHPSAEERLQSNVKSCRDPDPTFKLILALGILITPIRILVILFLNLLGAAALCGRETQVQRQVAERHESYLNAC